MSLQEHISISPYVPSDRQGVRRVSYETSFAGNPGEFFEDSVIVADFLTLYFTDWEPESCFVLKDGREVAGYIIGTKNIRRMNIIMAWRVVPFLVLKALCRGVFLSRKNIRLLRCYAGSFFKGEFHRADWIRDFQAAFHVNLREGYRGQGLGWALVDRFFVYLRESRVTGVQISTTSEDAKNYFLKKGFQVLDSAQRSYLSYKDGQTVSFYLLGKCV